MLDSEVCDFYHEHTDYSLADIADVFGVSKTTISRVLKRNSIMTLRRHTIANLKNDIIAYYYSKPMTLQEVANVFGFCVPSIIKLFRQENVMQYSRTELFSPDMRVDYFDVIDSPLKAYFLGLLFADGCIFESDSSKRLCISLIAQDVYLLDLLLSELCCNNSLVYSERDDTFTLAITSDTLCNMLITHGMAIHKQNREAPLGVSDEMLPAFTRGYFDGDGCICTRSSGKCIRTDVSFCGPHKIISFIRDSLVSKLCVANNIVRSENGTHIVRWSAKDDIISIADYLYTHGPSVTMRRKAEKFLKFIKFYNS